MKPPTLILALAALCVLVGLVVGALRVGPRRRVAIVWWQPPLILGLGISGVALSFAPDLGSVWTLMVATPIGWLFVTGILSGVIGCSLTFGGDDGCRALQSMVGAWRRGGRRPLQQMVGRLPTRFVFARCRYGTPRTRSLLHMALRAGDQPLNL